eukprot:1683061-Karenia_brevis.AAC.1
MITIIIIITIIVSAGIDYSRCSETRLLHPSQMITFIIIIIIIIISIMTNITGACLAGIG